MQPDILTDEPPELIRRNFAQPLKTRDLHLATQRIHRHPLLLFAIAINRLLLIPHTEERCFENKHVASFHQVRKELQEERHQQQPDMHSIHVRICGNDHLVISQTLQSVLDVQRMLQEVELLVLINHFFRQPVAIQWLSTETEDRLRADVARLRDRTTGRITLRDKDHRLNTFFVFVVEMKTAVAKLLVVKICFFCTFVRKLLDTRDLLALALRL